MPMTTEHRNKIIQEISNNKSLQHISTNLNIELNLLVDQIVCCIKHGMNVSKEKLKTLCPELFECSIGIVRSKIHWEHAETTVDTIINEICKDEVCKALEITRSTVQIIVAYEQVRHYLDELKVPYVDIDSNELKNAELLLKPAMIKPLPMPQVPQKPGPSHSNNPARQSIDDHGLTAGDVLKFMEKLPCKNPRLFLFPEGCSWEAAVAQIEMEDFEEVEEEGEEVDDDDDEVEIVEQAVEDPIEVIDDDTATSSNSINTNQSSSYSDADECIPKKRLRKSYVIDSDGDDD